MANCASYDCGNDFPAYSPTQGCNTKYFGGANQVVLFRCGQSVDPDSVTLSADVLALIASGNATKLTNVKVNFEAPSPVTGPSLVGCVPDGLITNDHTITLVDRNVNQDTSDFYDTIQVDFGAEIGGIMIYECKNDRVTYYDLALSMQGGRVFPDQQTDLDRYEWTLVGQSLSGGKIRDIGSGLFN